MKKLLLVFVGILWFGLHAKADLLWTLHSEADVVYQSVDQIEDSYIIALDTYRKKSNRWLPGEFKSIKGRVSRYTLELPRHVTSEQAFAFYRQQLPEGAQPLFSCQKRQCAESNNWANDHFKIKQLYGQDATQYYGVFTLPNVTPEQYYVIYSLRRGNRRLYVQLESVEAI